MVFPGFGQWLLIGITVGLVAAVAMDVLMTQQEDGFAPARIAAGILTRRSPANVSLRDAVVVHHVASGFVGALYSTLSFALAALVPLETSVGGVDVVPHVVAVTVVVGFVHSLFTFVAIPRVDESIYEERATAVHGQWLRAAALFGAVMLLGVPALAAVFA